MQLPLTHTSEKKNPLYKIIEIGEGKNVSGTLNDTSTNLYHVFEFRAHPHTTPPCCDETGIL